MENSVDITLTEAALLRVKELLEQEKKQALYLSVKEAGCSGLEYVMDCIDHPHDGDLEKRFDEITIYVDADAYHKALKGLRLDFQRDLLSSGFVYDNPNQKGTCGCGISFSV